MTSNQIKIFYVDNGIANRYEGRVEINKRLKKYPSLLKEIIEHELAHTDKGYSFSDFKLDCKGMKNKLEYWRFVVSEPSAWGQFLPIIKGKQDRFYIDPSLVILYSATLLCVIGGIILWLI